MRTNFVAAASLLASLSYASPVQTRDGELVEKRQAPGPGNYFAITGATGGVHPRLEVRELEKTGEMWNLFLLAMTDFQAMDQKLINSWFQIAGIHGMPWTSWDGVQGSTEGKGYDKMGYCPHANQLFGTWHRPYLALFEQQLQTVAKTIADKFPTATKAKYQDAATKLRVPYWDWAKAIPLTQTVLPTSLTVEKVQVTFPNGTAAQIDNPLFDYNFHPLDNTQINGTGCATIGTQAGAVGGDPGVCQNSKMTIRKGYVSSDHPALETRLRDILSGQRSLLLRILSQYQPFDVVSNGGNCGESLSPYSGDLESLHNPIHVSNWPGHMSPASVSAFDPMFWMHHANVDRQLALFQALYPNTYIDPCAADTDTFTITKGQTLNVDSPLTPFHRNKAGDFWTSANSRNIASFGYTYPELANNPSNATLTAAIKAQYSGPASPSNARKVAVREPSTGPRTETLYLASITILGQGLNNGLGGSSPYNVIVFLGDVATDPKKWVSGPSFVGLASALGGHNMQSNSETPNWVDLGDAVKKAIADGKTTEENAVEYLKENLKWRVELGENEIPREKVPGLKVGLVSTKVKIAEKDDEFDQWFGGVTEYGLVDV